MPRKKEKVPRGSMTRPTRPLPQNPNVQQFLDTPGSRYHGRVGKVKDPVTGEPMKKGSPVPAFFSGDVPSRARLLQVQAREAAPLARRPPAPRVPRPTGGTVQGFQRRIDQEIGAANRPKKKKKK